MVDDRTWLPYRRSLLLDSGIFVVGRDGDLVAGHGRPSEFIDSPAMLKARQRRFDGEH